MFKAYAKVRGNQVIDYPYGFDDLQQDVGELLSGEVSFIESFAKSKAAAEGYSLVEVFADERQSIDLPPGQKPVISKTPALVDGKWILPLVGTDASPPPTGDGKFYFWNRVLGMWQEVPNK